MSSSVANMICPECGQFQETAEVCARCGVVMSKVKRQEAPSRDTEGLQDPAPLARKSTAVASRKRAAALSTPAKVAIAGAFLVIVSAAYPLFTPQTMSIEEFIEVKKDSFHMRGFRIEGIAEPYRETYLIAQRSDGKELSSMKVTAYDKTGYVTYDPDTLDFVPSKGDRVSVTGDFKRVPYYGLPGSGYRTMTMAYVTSIKLLETHSD